MHFNTIYPCNAFTSACTGMAGTLPGEFYVGRRSIGRWEPVGGGWEDRVWYEYEVYKNFKTQIERSVLCWSKVIGRRRLPE
jgi:hypothetical protein